ncbi:MAG TPA: PQQ-binding-like beta-propeller repeat protein [Candidatus Polarisedimenticolia bacterium]|jgi:outer membrane protein assembly factor BamB
MILFVFGLAAAQATRASEWARWRGPDQNGSSGEKGLVSSWSPGGENLLWRADFTGRSTPVVFDGRACAAGRTGGDAAKQEVVACWDAATGAKLWEHRFNVYLTSVPFTRVGWANIEGDPETSNLYVHGVQGLLQCFDRKGKLLWSRSLTEQFGRVSGYGGRTHSPIVDEDRVILGFSNFGWGDQAQPRHRYFAFDKRTGDLLWVSTPGGRPDPITTQATPVVAEIEGQRLLIGGNGDGWIYAMKARTGEKVWSFQLSKLGMNTSVVVDGWKVYATSGDENIDEGTKGRVVCIDGRGKGDITKTGEIWRADELEAGFASPLLHGGALYVVDDSANMFALDAATGKQRWSFNIGTVGKASPVWADGKIYAAEVNGRFHIIAPEETRAVALDMDQITMPDGRRAEIYGSPAVAYGRIYLATEAGLFCIGGKGTPPVPSRSSAPPVAPEAAPAGAKSAWLQITPYETVGQPAESIAFHARTYDSAGRLIGDLAEGAWSLDGLGGTIDAKGRFTPDSRKGAQSGSIIVQSGELKATARVRIFPELPWEEGFEALETGKNPTMWVGGAGRFVAGEREGRKVLTKPFLDQGIERSSLFIGTPAMSGYTIQADLLGSTKGHKRPDMGLINSGYTLDMMGVHQRLEVRDWEERRFHKTIDFSWEPDLWYRMKLIVKIEGDKAVIRAKVWKAGDQEPASWTMEAEDPLPIRQGSPGLYGYSAADIFYDNVKVAVNPK